MTNIITTTFNIYPAIVYADGNFTRAILYSFFTFYMI